MPNDLTVTLQAPPSGPHVLVVAGDLDHHTSSRLSATLDEVAFDPAAGLVVDLSALTFCDSTGIAALIDAHRRAREAGTPLVLAGLDPEIARVLRIMGLDRLFSFYDSVREAADALRSRS